MVYWNILLFFVGRVYWSTTCRIGNQTRKLGNEYNNWVLSVSKLYKLPRVFYDQTTFKALMALFDPGIYIDFSHSKLPSVTIWNALKFKTNTDGNYLPTSAIGFCSFDEWSIVHLNPGLWIKCDMKSDWQFSPVFVLWFPKSMHTGPANFLQYRETICLTNVYGMNLTSFPNKARGLSINMWWRK